MGINSCNHYQQLCRPQCIMPRKTLSSYGVPGSKSSGCSVLSPGGSSSRDSSVAPDLDPLKPAVAPNPLKPVPVPNPNLRISDPSLAPPPGQDLEDMIDDIEEGKPGAHEATKPKTHVSSFQHADKTMTIGGLDSSISEAEVEEIKSMIMMSLEKTGFGDAIANAPGSNFYVSLGRFDPKGTTYGINSNNGNDNHTVLNLSEFDEYAKNVSPEAAFLRKLDTAHHEIGGHGAFKSDMIRQGIKDVEFVAYASAAKWGKEFAKAYKMGLENLPELSYKGIKASDLIDNYNFDRLNRDK